MGRGRRGERREETARIPRVFVLIIGGAQDKLVIKIESRRAGENSASHQTPNPEFWIPVVYIAAPITNPLDRTFVLMRLNTSILSIRRGY